MVKTKDQIILNMLVENEKTIQKRFDRALGNDTYSYEYRIGVDVQLAMIRSLIKTVRKVVEA